MKSVSTGYGFTMGVWKVRLILMFLFWVGFNGGWGLIYNTYLMPCFFSVFYTDYFLDIFFSSITMDSKSLGIFL